MYLEFRKAWTFLSTYKEKIVKFDKFRVSSLVSKATIMSLKAPLNSGVFIPDTGGDVGHSLEEWSEDKVTSLIPRRERKRENGEPSTDSHLNWRKWRGKTVKPWGQMENRRRRVEEVERENTTIQ